MTGLAYFFLYNLPVKKNRSAEGRFEWIMYKTTRCPRSLMRMEMNWSRTRRQSTMLRPSLSLKVNCPGSDLRWVSKKNNYNNNNSMLLTISFITPPFLSNPPQNPTMMTTQVMNREWTTQESTLMIPCVNTCSTSGERTRKRRNARLRRRRARNPRPQKQSGRPRRSKSGQPRN